MSDSWQPLWGLYHAHASLLKEQTEKQTQANKEHKQAKKQRKKQTHNLKY